MTARPVRFLPTPLLFLITLAAVGADLALVGPEAVAEDAVVALPMPNRVPLEAMLTGPVVDNAAVDGVEARIDRDETAWALVLTNPGPEEVEVSFEVETWQTSGSMVSRMGPISTQVGTDPVVARIPAGQTVRVPLPHAPEPPAAGTPPEGAELALDNVLLGFATLEFEVKGQRDRTRLRQPLPVGEAG